MEVEEWDVTWNEDEQEGFFIDGPPPVVPSASRLRGWLTDFCLTPENDLEDDPTYAYNLKGDEPTEQQWAMQFFSCILKERLPINVGELFHSDVGLYVSAQILACITNLNYAIVDAYGMFEDDDRFGTSEGARWNLLDVEKHIFNDLSWFLVNLLKMLPSAIQELWQLGHVDHASKWERIYGSFSNTNDILNVQKRRVDLLMCFNQENFNAQDRRFAESQHDNMTLLECLDAQAFEKPGKKSCKTWRLWWLPCDVVSIVRSYLCQFPVELEKESDHAIEIIHGTFAPF
jgi:hypothetical protein